MNYHDPRSPHLTCSAFKMFLDDIEKFARVYEHHTAKPDPPNDGMLRGQLLHAVTELPREVLERMVANVSAFNLDDFLASMSCVERVLNSHPFTVQDFEAVIEMTRSLLQHRRASQLLWHPEALTEQVHEWECSESGLLRKYKADRKFPPGTLVDEPLTVDLKSMGRDCDVKQFRYAAADYHYREQAEYYRDGGEHEYGTRPLFIFIAVSSATYRVNCFEASYEVFAQQMARQRVTDELAELSRRRSSGDWSPRQDVIKF